MVGKFIPMGISVGIDKGMPELEADTLKQLKGFTETMQMYSNDFLYKRNGIVGNSYINNIVNNTTPSIKNIVKAVLNVDGKEFTREVVAPNQDVLDNYALGR